MESRRRPLTTIHCPLSTVSMRQRVHNVIDPEFISLVRLFDRPERIVRKLPVIAHVIIVIDDHHQPPVLVLQAPEFRRVLIAVIGLTSSVLIEKKQLKIGCERSSFFISYSGNA